MLRTRLFLLFLGCLFLASASWASDTGYIDCSKYPDSTQVLSQGGKTNDAVATLPCGERFTVLVRGVFYSQIQTKDGKVGYIYTYLITTDTSAASKPKAATSPASAPAEKASASSAIPADMTLISRPPSGVPPTAAASSASPQPVPAVKAAASPSAAALPEPSVPPQPQSASAANPPAPGASAAAPQPQPQPAESSQAQVSATAPAAASTASAEQPKATASAQPAPLPNVSAPTAASEQPKTAASVQPEAASAAQPSVSSAPAPQPQPTAPAVQPTPSAPASTQPTPAQPPVEEPQIRTTRPAIREPFPNASGVPMIELFAGYGFTRFGGGTGTNLNGALGSFGFNLKPWLQIIGDASYSLVTVSGTRNVVYGNHFGPRIFLRSRSARGPIPFVEALVGGTRIDATTAGVTTSSNGLSYKAGGGADLIISRHIAVRLGDFDYYRIQFLTGSQNNYSASAGIIFRFGGHPEY